MGMKRYAAVVLAALLAAMLVLGGCSKQRQVVVYTSVDQVFSEPVFRQFEQETGIKVKAVYDVEAQKTTGLVNRLVAEKGGATADVFWSGECMQTTMLKEEGVLAAYTSPEAAALPDAFLDGDAMFTAFGGRARVLLVNTDLMDVADAPTRMADLATWGDDLSDVAIAYPMFGTTATHAAALYALWGAEAARQFHQTIYNRGIAVVDGNGLTRDMVAEGRIAMGLTDTDDAFTAVEEGRPVELVFLDQGGDGTLVIPNTVGLVAGGENPDEGRLLIDYLLSAEMERQLREAGWFDISLREGGEGTLDVMDISWADVYAVYEQSSADMAEIFVR